MDTNDDTVKKTEQIINTLDYAQKHNLDINKSDDVKKILNALGHEQSNEDVEEIMKLLQDSDTFLEIMNKKDSDTQELPN